MKHLAFAGFAIWLAATIALRLIGQWIVRPGTVLDVALLLAVSGALMYRLPRGLFKLMRIARSDYTLGVILLVAPGMLLDTISAIWFSRVFPNMPVESAGLFGGWLLFCNVVALLSAAIAAGSPSSDTRVAL
ncbi:MAG TPA: DUF5367 family protein [Vicinamibacterales bacterium]